MEPETKAKDYSIQQIVNHIGQYIQKNKIKDAIPASKAIGEVEIDNILYQIQVVLVPNKSKWINENGVIRTFKKPKPWIKRKISSLFKFTTDVEIQK